jgi:hypothetical protein
LFCRDTDLLWFENRIHELSQEPGHRGEGPAAITWPVAGTSIFLDNRISMVQDGAMPSSKKRISVTFPSDYYAELQRIAEQSKVSVAWVVRDAVEKYLTQQSPLFPPQGDFRRDLS